MTTDYKVTELFCILSRIGVIMFNRISNTDIFN